MSLLIEILSEILFEGYLELMMLLFPRKSAKWLRVIAALLLLIELTALFFAFFGGLSILLEQSPSSFAGWILVILPVTVSIVQITLGILHYFRNHRG